MRRRERDVHEYEVAYIAVLVVFVCGGRKSRPSFFCYASKIYERRPASKPLVF